MLRREWKITIGEKEIEDLQWAIRAGINRLNADGLSADFQMICRLVFVWDRLEYLRTHDDKGAPLEETQ